MRTVRSTLLQREVSVLGFGTASVMGSVGRKESLAALQTAFDAGINIFDTARSYGYGEAEGLLGEFLEGRREKVVISSKFGIVPAPQTRWKRLAKPVARAALRAMPSLRKSIRSTVGSQLQAGQFTVKILNESISTSLRKLRTDYLDILLMHEANLEALGNEELLRAMERLVHAGKVRIIGVSADPTIVAAALKFEEFGAIQFACHLDNGFASALNSATSLKPMIRMANHPFGGVSGVGELALNFHTNNGPLELPPDLWRRLTTDNPVTNMADFILNHSLLFSDVVLVTMMKPAHILTNVAVVKKSSFQPAELRLIRKWLTERRAGLIED